MKRLKNKVWRDYRIDISRLVERTIDDDITSHKTVAFLVTIHQSAGRRTMFRADSIKELWADIIDECRIFPTEAELEEIRAKDSKKPYVPYWQKVMGVK